MAQETKKGLERFKEHDRETFDGVINRLMRIGKSLEKKRRASHWSSALLSEKSLAEDWLSKEDEKAWKDL
ncbi:MAG: hypothetical protein Q7R47_02685 [Candidatus Diapherotrites archaeon]|nr:hypothetical protein [Candidatus Diapherotrites archaeon]